MTAPLFSDVYDFNLQDKASQIGTGAFSTVHRCIHKKEHAAYAVKVINMDKLKPSDKPKVEREAFICQQLNHKNIVRLKEAFKESKYFFLVFELVSGGELFEDIVNRQFYNEADASSCIYQIMCAIQACHKKNIIHRDLKPENLLLSSKDPDAVVKLTDFGLAVVMDQGPAFFGFAGTPGYLAPEVCARQPYGLPVDMWAVGVILYILLVGYPPFWHDDQQELFEQIKRGQFEFPSPEWDTVTSEAKDLIRRLLDVNTATRLTVDQAMAHPWIARRDVVASRMHRQSTIDQLRRFNARRKLRGAVHVLAASRFLLQSPAAPGTPTTPTPRSTGLLGVITAATKQGAVSPVDSSEKERLPPTPTPTPVPSTIPLSRTKSTIVTQLSQAASTDGQEVLNVNSRLLDAIAAKDWTTYSTLTDANMTCFEPEAGGCLVVGQDFHKFYFENGEESRTRTTVIDPRVRMLGDTAIVTYVRLLQASSGAKVTSARFEETRVYYHDNGRWINVHFHRSAVKM